MSCGEEQKKQKSPKIDEKNVTFLTTPSLVALIKWNKKIFVFVKG